MITHKDVATAMQQWSVGETRWRFLWRKMRSRWTVWMQARFLQISLH